MQATNNWYLRRDTTPMPGDNPGYDEIDGEKWFGAYTASAGGAAWVQLDKWCARTFPGCHLLKTPVQTALALADDFPDRCFQLLVGRHQP